MTADASSKINPEIVFVVAVADNGVIALFDDLLVRYDDDLAVASMIARSASNARAPGSVFVDTSTDRHASFGERREATVSRKKRTGRRSTRHSKTNPIRRPVCWTTAPYE